MINKKNLLIFVLALLFLILTVKTVFLEEEEKRSGSVKADDSGATVEGIEVVEKANNEFALKLYSKLAKDNEGENLFFSPYSISTALAMTYEGAESKTAEEIREVFGFPEEDDARRPAMAALYNRLNPENPEYELKTANALWIQDSFKILNDFTDTIERYYVGSAKNVDFEGDTEKSRETINDWVAQKTNDIINELFPEGSITPLTRLVLTNAIYFKGDWVMEFDEDLTEDSPFRVNDTTTVDVPMMRSIERKYGYYEDDSVQILELGYKGDRLSMLVILPEDEDLASLEETISLEKVSEWREGIVERDLNIYLPKFKLDTKYDLKKQLDSLGMPLAFTPPSQNGADFSGITGKRDLFVGAIVHDAFISVDEVGTEAAAATGVEMRLEMAMEGPPVFRANRPFLFLIQEKESGNILFLGRVINPSQN